MSVKRQESELLRAASEYAANTNSYEVRDKLCIAAAKYGDAKRQSANARDRWKLRKRGLDGNPNLRSV